MLSALAARRYIKMAPRKKTQQLKTGLEQTESDLTAPFDEGHIVVPLVEESLDVKKNWVQAGEVVFRKTVDTHTEEVPVELGYEEVQIDRVPVNRVLREGETAEPRQEGDLWIIPVVKEEMVVLKRQVVKEEIRVTKRRATREETIREEV